MKGLMSGPLSTPSLADHYYPDLRSARAFAPPPPPSPSKIPNEPSSMHPSFLSPFCPLLELGEGRQEDPEHTIPLGPLKQEKLLNLGPFPSVPGPLRPKSPHGLQKSLGLGPVFMF